MYIDLVTVEITDKCNAKCPQCMRTNPNGCTPDNFVRNIDISLDDFKSYLSIKLLKNIKKISFNCPMGDPVAHSNIFSILDYIVSNNPNISIDFPTNGSLRNKEYWIKLASYKQVVVTFALDGIDNATHQYYRRNTNFSKILDNASIFIQAGGKAIWQFIIFQHNSSYEETAKQMAYELGFDKFVSFHSTRFNNTDTFIYVYEDTQHELKIVDTDVNYRNDLHFGQKNKVSSINCKSLDKKEIFIDIEGNIMPCCYHAGSLFATKHIPQRNSFNNYLDVSFESYDTSKFNIKIEGFDNAFKMYLSYMEDLKEKWRTINPPLCKSVCGKCN